MPCNIYQPNLLPFAIISYPAKKSSPRLVTPHTYTKILYKPSLCEEVI